MGARGFPRAEPHFYLDTKIKKIKMSTNMSSEVDIVCLSAANGCTRWRHFVLAPVSFKPTARA